MLWGAFRVVYFFSHTGTGVAKGYDGIDGLGI